MKWLSVVVLAGCTPLGVSGGAAPVAWYVYPLPACLLLCTSHVSAMREDVVSGGSAPVTTGAKSTSSSSSASKQ